MIGKKVRLTKKMAKWLIEHQDIYYMANDPTPFKDLDGDMWVCLLTIMDVPVYGMVTREGDRCWRVDFKTPFGKVYSFYDRKDLWCD